MGGKWVRADSVVPGMFRNIVTQGTASEPGRMPAGKAPLIHQLPNKIDEYGCIRLGSLLKICARCMAALRDLIVEEGLAELLHPCRELPRVYRADAIILRGREDQRFW